VLLLRNVLTTSLYIKKGYKKTEDQSILYHTWTTSLGIQVPLENSIPVTVSHGIMLRDQTKAKVDK